MQDKSSAILLDKNKLFKQRQNASKFESATERIWTARNIR